MNMPADTRGRILFAGENEDVAAMSVPTIFTGQRIGGTLLLSQQTTPPSFDTVHIVLKGISACVLSIFLCTDGTGS